MATNDRILYLAPSALSVARGKNELRRRRGMLESWAAPGFQIEVVDNPAGPPSIESACDEYACVPGSLEIAVNAERSGYTAIILGCFGDPGLAAFREVLSIPIVGPFEASIHVACTLGHRFGIITTLHSGVPSVRKLVRSAGLDSRLASIVACEVPVAALEGGSYDSVIGAGHAILADGADTIILGCMSMAFLGIAPRLRAELGVPIVDPARTALKAAELLLGSDLAHSRRAYGLPSASAGDSFADDPKCRQDRTLRGHVYAARHDGESA